MAEEADTVKKRKYTKKEYITRCPNCGSEELKTDYERAEIICKKCGLVVESGIADEGPEWRAFDHDQTVKRSRTGAPMTYTIHDKGLSTAIDWKDKDSYGKDVKARRLPQLYRIRKWHRRARVSNATEKNLAYALTELDRMASKLNLPKQIKETAALIYRQAVEKGLIRGRSIEGVTAAALYAACRKLKVPRTLDEIVKVAYVPRKEIGRTYRFIVREMGLKFKPTSPVSYIQRFSSELGLSPEVQSKAIEILKKAKSKELTSGRGPTGVAAAAIYISSIQSGERRTQREVAEVAGVTEVTIRNRYKELAEELGIKINI